MNTLFSDIMQLLLVGIATLAFYLFRILVAEVSNLRKEVHLLNEKIAEILASYKVFEVRLKYLENKNLNGGNNED